jgi:hypothetical protein
MFTIADRATAAEISVILGLVAAVEGAATK